MHEVSDAGKSFFVAYDFRHPGRNRDPGFIDAFHSNGQNVVVSGFVYIMASRKNGTLYVGVTSDLAGRVWEHKEKIYPRSFTAMHKVERLVWFEEFDDIRDAIDHEKRMKRWRRAWKIQAIQKRNPEWDDLYLDIAQH